MITYVRLRLIDRFIRRGYIEKFQSKSTWLLSIFFLVCMFVFGFFFCTAHNICLCQYVINTPMAYQLFSYKLHFVYVFVVYTVFLSIVAKRMAKLQTKQELDLTCILKDQTNGAYLGDTYNIHKTHIKIFSRNQHLNGICKYFTRQKVSRKLSIKFWINFKKATFLV